ncbi:hypothetical protein AB0C91_24350 [Streptomyces sp. NPDC048674]|uniref:hypothetical protein n=1 Tax=Streptomyces sp. NPDC048674 TaxID=3155491 RepID=UPI00342C1C5D
MADANIEQAKANKRAAEGKDDFRLRLPAGLAAILGVGLFLGWIVNAKLSDDDQMGEIGWWWCLPFLASGVILWAVHQIRHVNQTAIFEKTVSAEEFNVRMVELDYIPDTDAPLAANRELLQRYHKLSTGQANAAFRLAAWVMGTVAALALMGAVAVVLIHDTATTVTLASITAVVSALGGYISSTLLATYRVSVEQARFYFRDPLAGGYLLAAEHLAKRLDPPEHTAALSRVVDGFIHAANNVPGAAQDSAPQEPPPGAPSAGSTP